MRDFIKMADTIRNPYHPIIETVEPESLQTERLQSPKIISSPNNSTAKEIDSRPLQKNRFQIPKNTNHRHCFTSFKPITVMNIYRDQSFHTVLNNLGRMSLVKCQECGVNFICFSAQDVKMENQRNFKHTFAAYYNTSQLDVKANYSP